MRRLVIIGLLLFLLLPSYAQEGQGIIREGIANDLANIGSLNPLRCDNAACYWAVYRLFPGLLAYNPETRWFGEGNAENYGLASSWDISEDNLVYTFHLREDAFWTDGSPITAYDYFYSYLAISSGDFTSPYTSAFARNIEGVVPLGDKDLVIIFKENNCDVLEAIHFPIAPAHVFDSDFATEASAFFDESDVREQWQVWDEAYNSDFTFMQETYFDTNPSVTSGAFEFVSYQPYGYIRLRAGDIAFELVSVPSSDEEVNSFLNGDLTILTNPPRSRWRDILAAEDVQVSQSPNSIWDYIAFNFEDPGNPQDAFDDDGNPIAQEPNPFFTDIRVRHAIQYAINVPELIEAGLQGQGTQIAAVFSPYAYAYDESLSPYPYEPDRARDLLNEAGWIQQGASRVCFHCGTAENGVRLNLNLSYGSNFHHYEVAILISRQLRQVGINVDVHQSDLESVMYQNFDLYLGTWGAPYVGESLETLFNPNQDIVGGGWNFGSYNNPQLSESLHQAQTLAGCDLEERIGYYQAAQRLLYEDLPYVWLYAHDTRMAVRGSVANFAPSIGEPLGDMRNWLIFDAPRG